MSLTEKMDNRDSDEKLVEIEMELLRYFTKIPMADQSFGNFLNLFESKQLQTKMPVFNTSR